MSQAMTPAAQEDRLSVWVAKPEIKARIASALGGWMDPDTFLAQMLISIEQRPELQVCTVHSKFAALHQCATLGLLPSLQQVALIARRMFKGSADERTDLTVMPQWQGLKALMERHPEVLEVVPMLVRTDDVIEFAGEGDEIAVARHQFDPLSHDVTPENIRGGYAKVIYRDGRRPRFHYVSKDYIFACRACSESYRYEKPDKPSVWTSWFPEQARKTVLRSAYSRRVVPIDHMVQGRIEAFLKHEDEMLGNDPRIVVESVTNAPLTIPVSRSAALAQQLRQPVSQPEPIIPLPPEPVPEATSVTPTSEPQVEEPAAEAQEGSDKVADFLLMMNTCKGDAQLESLYDSWCGPDSKEELTDAERTSISNAVEGERKRRREAKKQRGQQGRLV